MIATVYAHLPPYGCKGNGACRDEHGRVETRVETSMGARASMCVERPWWIRKKCNNYGAAAGARALTLGSEHKRQ
jgi:hypothetical protein